MIRMISFIVGFFRIIRDSNLKLTEVSLFPAAVELYLDSYDSIDIYSVSLEVETAAGYSNNLNLVGTMPSKSFLVIFEKGDYSGPPISETFTDPLRDDQIPGIAVAEGSFGINLGGTSFAYRISGVAKRRLFGSVFVWFAGRRLVDDVVKFGTRPRPSIGGNFTEDTVVPVGLPPPPGSVGRKWGPDGPIDNDLESDWQRGLPTWGRPTQ